MKVNQSIDWTFKGQKLNGVVTRLDNINNMFGGTVSVLFENGLTVTVPLSAVFARAEFWEVSNELIPQETVNAWLNLADCRTDKIYRADITYFAGDKLERKFISITGCSIDNAIHNVSKFCREIGSIWVRLDVIEALSQLPEIHEIYNKVA